MPGNKPWYYDKIRFFDGLSPMQRTELEAIGFVKKVKKGAMIYWLGNQYEHVYILKKGTTKSFLLTSNGKEVTLAVRRSGDILGLTSVFCSCSALSYVIALSDTDLLAVKRNRLKDWIDRNKDVNVLLTKILAARLHHSRMLIEDLATRNVLYRLTNFLLRSCDEHGKETAQGIVIAKFTQEEISKIIAASRQTVSMLLCSLEKEKLVTRKGRNIIITDRERLEGLGRENQDI